MYMKKKNINDYLTQFNITEDYLRDAYITRQLSLPEIKIERGIDFKSCAKLLRHFKIPVRTISESRMTSKGKERIINSIKQKYGVENPSQIESVKEKKRETFKKHYGVDNIWKSKKYYEWLDGFMLENYGCKRLSNDNFTSGITSKNWWKSLTQEEKEIRIRKTITNLHKSASKNNTIEVKMSVALDTLKLEYERFYPIKTYTADFYLKNFNLIIECFGDFWHANPNKYKADDVLNFPGTKGVKAKDLWEKDRVRLDTYKKMGYTTIVIWETEIKNSVLDNTLPLKIMELIKPK